MRCGLLLELIGNRWDGMKCNGWVRSYIVLYCTLDIVFLQRCDVSWIRPQWIPLSFFFFVPFPVP